VFCRHRETARERISLRRIPTNIAFSIVGDDCDSFRGRKEIFYAVLRTFPRQTKTTLLQHYTQYKTQPTQCHRPRFPKLCDTGLTLRDAGILEQVFPVFTVAWGRDCRHKFCVLYISAVLSVPSRLQTPPPPRIFQNLNSCEGTRRLGIRRNSDCRVAPKRKPQPINQQIVLKSAKKARVLCVFNMSAKEH